MKAITHTRYGTPDVLQLTEVERPRLLADEVLIEVHASSVSTGDFRSRASAFPGVMWLPGRLYVGLFRPKNTILGGDVAGRIVEVGEDVTRFAVGDEVFGYCGVGSNAEFVAMQENDVLMRKPENLTFVEAAAIPNGALCAHDFVTKLGEVKAGDEVLVVGASGGVGSYAVQIAKHLGAKVTGVCSTDNVELVRSLGADHVVDYRNEDFRDNGVVYDVIIDTVGATDFVSCQRSLSATGRHVFVAFGPRELWQMFRTAKKARKVVCGVMAPSLEAMEAITAMARSGALKPVFDRTYPLHETAAAHAFVEAGGKRGSVVITVAEDAKLALVA